MPVRMIWSCEYDGCAETTETTAEISGGQMEDMAVYVPESFGWVRGFEGRRDWTLCSRHYEEVLACINAEQPDEGWFA